MRRTVPPSAEIEEQIEQLLAVGVGDNPRVVVGAGQAGSVWATALWEMHWALVNGVRELRLPGAGFREDLFDLSEPLAGNQVALRLVMNGLKLQPCLPTFLDARDAILQADQRDFGAAHRCIIWWASAERGMGVDARDREDLLGDSLDVTEDFTLPADCARRRGG